MINMRPTPPCRSASIYLLMALILFTSFSPGIDATPSAESGQAGSDSPAVMVERSTNNNATTYSIALNDCKIEWIARNTEVGVVKLWSQCALPLSQQMPLIERLYEAFLRADKNARALRTLFLGEIDRASHYQQLAAGAIVGLPFLELDWRIEHLRARLAERFGADAAGSVRILYGGSVTPGNIAGLMAKRDIDGALVGGASLDPDKFASIVRYWV